jgi:amino acid adenylation domain-containing protein/non-ribosomal peptide synthase protein (TIGR01720 family)
MSYHLRAPYELSALHEALAVIADRHPILRTSFEFEGFEEPLQLVHRKAAIPLAETDLRGSSSDSQDEAVRDWAEHERHQPFAPDTAPLLHAHVHRRGDDDLQFSISFHHAILDGWSVASMLTELFEEYLRLLRRPLALPPPPELTFRDFVALEQRVLATPDERIFWTQFLEDAPFSPLPRWQAEREERPRSIRQQRFEISEQTSLGLKQLADDAGVPLRSVLLAAHLRAIAHIANQNDVVTGLVTNGRPEQADGDRVLGLFLNTIPFRLRLDGGTWLALVQETFRTEQQLSPHRRFPLSEIQKVCGGRSLFEVDFNFVHFHVFDQLAGLEGFESLDGQGFEETNFTLAVNFSWWGSPGRLGGGLDHDTTAIADEQARAYRDCYGEILDAMAARPEERYETRSLLSVVERRRLLVDFQSAPVPRSELALHQLITLRSEAIAVSSEDHFVPYEELQRRSNQLAQVLRRMGVGPDVLVGVGLEPGPERVVSLLAILKAGGAYVPLDPGYPRQRLALMIEDSGLSHLITKRGVLPEGLAPVGKAILVDEWTTFDGEPDAAPDVVVSPENLAYVLYTSGSTGRPKGVLITHRGIVNHMLWMQREYPLTPDDRVFQKTPFSFDASVWEFWAPLMAGASLYVGRLGGQQDPAYLVETIRAQRVTVLQVVPTLLEALLAEPGFGACRSLRRVFVGGEALSFGLRRRFHATLPATDLINLYGPTEATIDTTSHRFDRDAVERLVPIGRPISNVRTYVLDSLLNLAPLGTEGDLFIGGDGLGRGYLNRPGLTAASFVPDPFVEEPGGRLYRTGDRARWLPNGVLEFRGRADDQVKFRGYRVELGEIESALALHPAVEKAVVSAATNRLVAYLVLDRVAAEPPAAELRSFLTQRLPDHMVPSVFMILDCLPLTHSGKVDRKALPLPDGEQAAARQEYVAPASEGEVVLAAAWESVLGVRQVGVHDNFFELGGDSIMSLQIVARVRRAGWKIAPRLILQEQTIARIAARAERVAGIQPAQVLLSGDVPLSPIQRTFFDQELANPHHWNQAMLLTVPAGFAVDAFRRALRAVESHHDSLRLRFTRSAAGWQQAYADEATEAPCDVIDLSDTTSDLRAERVTREASRIQAALDISRGPVMRAAHFNFGDGHEGRLLLVLHHLVVDGVSWRILLEDLATAYEQALREQPFALPEKTASFRAWVERLQVHAASAVETFWLDLASRDVPRLPVDVPEGRDDHSESAARSFGSQLDADATRALIHDLPGRARAQITEVLLAALVESVSDWTGGDTLWLDLEGHGREDLFEGLDVSRTVGWFTSLFPLALARANGERSIALLRSVKSQLREVPANGLDFGVLRYLSTDSTLRSRLSAMPPRAISFNYLGRFDQLPAEAPFRPALESVGFDHDPAAPRQYLLDVIARVVEGRLTVEWIYAGRAFHDETIERLASAFMEKLPVLIEDALASEDVGYVPSDFPLARIDQQSLQALTAGRTDVVDLLPLSSLQEGLLFHALDEEQEGVYVQQITVRMEGHPNQLAFERAWNRTIERHAILRTSFHRADLSRPLQLVHREAACPATWLDWRALSEPERERQWATLLEQDRLDRFDFERPPLMRLTVVREGERQWRLLWTHHHLLLDGWSLPLLLREVVALYREESEGVEAALSSPPSYSTYIAWLERRDHADAESYWRSALSGFTHANEIALPPPATSVEAPYADAELRLPEDLTARLTELAQAWRVTLNTVVQGLWALLLSNYSRQPDVVFGVTVSGRPAELPGIENTVGLFINTLPLRVSVAAGDSLIEFLQQVQCRQVAMSQFEYSRLVDVQGWSEVPRGRSLFDTIVVFENYPLGESLADVPLADFAVTGVGAVEWTHYPLTCFVTPGRRLRIKLVYQTKRFDRPQIDRLLEHAHVLLAAIGKDSEKPLGALSPLTKVEREQVLLAWNDTAEEYEPARPFHERFAAQASQTPDAPAVVFEERSLNYRELDEQSNQLASTLRTLGIGPEKLVAILMDRSLEMVVALLGVLKAGGAYLPLDPRFPVERLAMMLEDGAPSVLLTQDALASRAPKVACPVIRVDSDWPRIATQSKLNVSSAVEPENLAYVIFTSGSTGRPKGVQIAHRALTNLLKTFARRPGMTSEDVMVAVTTLSFDIAGLELYLPLMCGSRLVIASAEDAADGERLAALLCGKGATVMQATPATWRLLLTTGWKPSPSLRMWCGGEAMPPDLAEALLTDGGELWNVYGPTETTIWSAIGPVRSSNDARSVGRPIGNTTLYVVDEWLNPMPIGLPGELLIGGDGLARGYRDQPALTAEKFVPDPFSSVPGARAYRTGDSVRVREDGSIEFLGRIDSQVKIRGFRVELGEIEAALRRDRDVREAVVAVRDDRQGQQRLVAYLVLETPERRPNLASELSSALRVRLPEYMVPGIYVDLAALPLTPNAKIDRKALPAPDLVAEAGRDSEFVAPRDALEEVLADLWRQTLVIDRVGVRDNFFALGGHSLHAAQIVASLRQAFQVKIPLRSLFEATSVEQLAVVLRKLDDQPDRLQRTAAALLKIKAMSPEERARRLEQRQARDQRRTS